MCSLPFHANQPALFLLDLFAFDHFSYFSLCCKTVFHVPTLQFFKALTAKKNKIQFTLKLIFHMHNVLSALFVPCQIVGSSFECLIATFMLFQAISEDKCTEQTKLNFICRNFAAHLVAC